MSKIDINSIEGYADMSLEQKIAALEGFDVPEPDLSGYVSKATFDKTSSELATAKKTIRDRMTTDEQAAEDAKKKDDLIADLTKKVAINDHMARFTALGYDADLAAKAATALADGDTAALFEVQKTFNAALLAKQKAELLVSTPGPVRDGESNPEVDYAAKAQEAMDAGDASKAAYYWRKAAEKKK